MSTYAVILAGGSGIRAGLSQPKQFALIGNRPLICHTIERFQSHPLVDTILIACHSDYIPHLTGIIAQYGYSKCAAVIQGGSTRQQSAWNILTGWPFHREDIILIHDAARPFVAEKSINAVICAAKKYGAADLCTPTTDTIIQTDGNGSITGIPDRKKLMNVQTPQGFLYETIFRAHDEAIKRNDTDASDDIGLVLKCGYSPVIVEGSPDNFKVTTKRDLFIAEAMIKEDWDFNQ